MTSPPSPPPPPSPPTTPLPRAALAPGVLEDVAAAFEPSYRMTLVAATPERVVYQAWDRLLKYAGENATEVVAWRKSA